MNSYYRLIDFLKNQLINDPDVNTVIHGAASDVDLDKKNIYPLAHIEVLRAGFPQGLVRVDFKVSVLDQRLVSKTPITDKFRKNDNEIDNLNTALAIINKLVFYLRNQNNNQDIELLNEPEPLPILFEFGNTLDGWEVEFSLAITNNVQVC